MRETRSYEAWSNERMDKLIEDKAFYRLSDVDRWNDKVKFQCDACNNEFEATPSNIQLGTGCPTCRVINQRGRRRIAKYTLKQAEDLCLERGWELLEKEYRNVSTRMRVRCIHCGNYTVKQLRVLLSGHTRCLECGRDD